MNLSFRNIKPYSKAPAGEQPIDAASALDIRLTDREPCQDLYGNSEDMPPVVGPDVEE